MNRFLLSSLGGVALGALLLTSGGCSGESLATGDDDFTEIDPDVLLQLENRTNSACHTGLVELKLDEDQSKRVIDLASLETPKGKTACTDAGEACEGAITLGKANTPDAVDLRCSRKVAGKKRSHACTVRFIDSQPAAEEAGGRIAFVRRLDPKKEEESAKKLYTALMALRPDKESSSVGIKQAKVVPATYAGDGVTVKGGTIDIACKRNQDVSETKTKHAESVDVDYSCGILARLSIEYTTDPTEAKCRF